MHAALKDLIVVIATAAIVAYSTGQREWLWKQIATVREMPTADARRDWGCPSIFDKKSCRYLKSR